MLERPLEQVLLDAVTIAFPLGAISELTRKLGASYRQSVEAFNDDPRIRQKDRKVLTGHLRFALINNDLVEFAAQYPDYMRCAEKMEGEEGENNHVELIVGDFLVTHHHHTKSDAMPDDFVNLGSGYFQNNSKVNEYFDGEWFTEKRIVSEPRDHLLNMLILHEKSPEGLHQIGNIEFVFPRKSKKFISLGVSDLTQRQTEIMDLDSDDLLEFKRRTAEEIRRYIA
ncbi:hypothetical protein [Luteolibacter luteus]|uniref:Uncharacterized protein n=1 Tax=Luteolibacter luteus TaxID=2728835 RepID=A0A858RRC6_9BACT|nr:hypothetical protein [Luteolibacter luteus]QJE99094.1 hypothetical protein HHL09_26050 [Luteolibacter luteus]